MNIIQQAAEDWNKSDERDYTYTGSILHFLQFLSQQGDAAIARSIIEGSISTWYNQDDAEELLCKALAIGRAMGNEELLNGLGAAIAVINEMHVDPHPDPGAVVDCINTAKEVFARYSRTT